MTTPTNSCNQTTVKQREEFSWHRFVLGKPELNGWVSQSGDIYLIHSFDPGLPGKRFACSIPQVAKPLTDCC